MVSVKGVRVFVPASQSGQPRGADLSAMVKQKVQLRITEVNRARRRVVGSIRSVTEEARKAAQAEVWANIEVGKHYTGTVKSMTSYGVFVDIGGVDGMVHISELSWSRIKTPAEVCKVGDTMDVYVISFDPEKKKISLGVKDHSIDPWQVFMDKYQVGDVASVRIVKLMTFGAFAEVVPGVDGLIHISQIADRRIDKPEDVLSEWLPRGGCCGSCVRGGGTCFIDRFAGDSALAVCRSAHFSCTLRCRRRAARSYSQPDSRGVPDG